MKNDLTADQIQQYQRDGVLSYPGLLDAQEVAQLKAAVLETIASMGKQKVADGGADMEAGDEFYDHVFTQRINLWRINDTVRRFMLHPDLGRMLCQLEGQSAFRVGFDQALIKEPFGNATAWHLDNPYWSFYSRHSISVWIALEEATPFNGCMCFLPGSQEMARFDNVGIGENMADLFKVYPEMTQIDTATFPMKPGDCSFHNGLTAHGAGANMTNGRRIAMTCAYMPDGSTFNGQQNVFPRDYFESLKPGQALDNDDLNPIVGRLEG
jgi:ectoine hydroxylase-related dioxygenase (phytanoyl-CoA dioxygenase family)